jgi:hypothetical protein
MNGGWHRAKCPRHRSLLAWGVFITFVGLLVSGKQAEAMITKIIIDSIQSPTFDGVATLATKSKSALRAGFPAFDFAAGAVTVFGKSRFFCYCP